ncbi:head-tail joining protein [Bradyrhizobium liaoningense]|uniref:head-tail joining protein n=1 Tax=Bradyrhizobium liaoningense TaxID=43992 RepID=UPI001BABF69F|nr:hypothetical protein [Bradyrhizobium liaoningense]MBR1170535.1 hypothetical protein [Bradyrhizobium liaoningense]
MPVESAADRAVFVSAADFGALATYAPAAGGGATTLPGIFDRPTIAAALNDAASLDARPTFLCRQADLPATADADAGDQLTVTGVGAFEVTSIEADGQGMALLRLGAIV